jgi:hypothetical protein
MAVNFKGAHFPQEIILTCVRWLYRKLPKTEKLGLASHSFSKIRFSGFASKRQIYDRAPHAAQGSDAFGHQVRHRRRVRWLWWRRRPPIECLLSP